MARRRPRARARPAPPPLSLTHILLIGLGAMALLGGLVWLALAYNHSGLIAILLPTLPILFSFLIEQCRKTMEELREDDDEDEEPDEAPDDERPHDSA